MTEAPIVVGGPFHGTLEASLDGHAIDGLELESTAVWGLFRTRGDEPHIVQVMRRLSPVEAWPPRLVLQSNFGVSGMRRHRIELMAARSREAASHDTASGRRYAVEPNEGAQPLELSLEPGRVRWSEGQILEVAGSEVEPGLQWCVVPSSDGDGMRYASQIFRVEGWFEGIEVDGFVGVDQVHLAPGRQYYVDDPMTASRLSDAWCTWATAYDDGSVECGHVSFGVDGFGFAVRASDGSAHVATHVTGRVVTVSDGCAVEIAVDIDGEPWEFVADPRGLALEPLPGPVRQSEGWFRRVGEARRPIVWCATPEIPSEAQAPAAGR
jgi:hypothetical protein